MKTKILSLFLFFLLLISVPAFANAACNAEDDPCAPKKELDAWQKSVAFGLNYTSGNTDTTALSLLSALNRETKDDIIDFTLNYGYGEDRAREDDGLDKTNKNDLRATGNYRYLITERFFAGAGVNFLYDEIADVDYRTTLIPSLGYFLAKNDDYKFSVDAGPAYIFEKVGGEENNYLAPKVGERFDWIISCTSKLYQSAEYFFDVDDSDNYLVNAELGIEAAISADMSLVLLVRDTYDNVPAADREKNDIATITAIKVSL